MFTVLWDNDGVLVDTEARYVDDGDVVTFGKVAFRVREVTPPSAQPAVESASTFGSSVPPAATIVRNIPVEADLKEKVARESSGGHVKVAGQSSEERQARKLSLLLDTISDQPAN